MDYQKIISEMTLEEKFNYLTGADMNSGYKLERFPVERMRYHDGPFGLRMISWSRRSARLFQVQ